MPETTFTDPDLTTFLGLDALGLIVVGLECVVFLGLGEFFFP